MYSVPSGSSMAWTLILMVASCGWAGLVVVGVVEGAVLLEVGAEAPGGVDVVERHVPVVVLGAVVVVSAGEEEGDELLPGALVAEVEECSGGVELGGEVVGVVVPVVVLGD